MDANSASEPEIETIIELVNKNILPKHIHYFSLSWQNPSLGWADCQDCHCYTQDFKKILTPYLVFILLWWS